MLGTDPGAFLPHTRSGHPYVTLTARVNNFDILLVNSFKLQTNSAHSHAFKQPFRPIYDSRSCICKTIIPPKFKMPSALILVADGSEEIEFVTPYDGQYTLSGRMLSRRILRADSFDSSWV